MVSKRLTWGKPNKSMELLMPGLGLIFWMTLSFGLVLYVLKKYAWGPILGMLDERERNLAKAKSDARRVAHELSQLDALKSARVVEADRIFAETTAKAREEADIIVQQAREKAREEARLIVEQTDALLETYKKQAMREIRSQISVLSMDMAEKILQEEFSDKERNARYVNKLLDELQLN